MLRSVHYHKTAGPVRSTVSNAKLSNVQINRSVQKARINTQAGQLDYSYMKTSSTFEPINTTIGHMLSTQVRESPHANALRVCHQDISWSFKDVKKHVEALANGFLEIGVKPGDRVGIIQGNTGEMVATQLACAKIGAICTPFVNVKKVKDFERHMQLFRPRIVLMPNKVDKMDHIDMIKEIWPHFGKAQEGVPVRSNKYPFCKRIIITERKGRPMMGKYRFDEILLYGPFGYYENPLRRIALQLTPDDPALILLNGKDVNKAKPVVFSHRNLLNAGKLLGTAAGLKAGDRVLIPGYQSALLGALANFTTFVSGATMVLPTATWKTDDILRLATDEQCTTIFAAPEDYEALLSHPDFSKYSYEHLRTAVVDQSAPEELITEIKGKFGIENVVMPSGEMEQTGVRKVNDEWAANSEIKIARHRDNKVMPLGETGSLRIKGPHTALGYWNDVGLQTNETDETGFFISGQDATMNREGEVEIVGKSKQHVDIVL